MTKPTKPVLTIISIGIFLTAFLIWWIYFKAGGVTTNEWVTHLPYANATFNGLSAICLVFGFLAIKKRNIETHKKWMGSAFVFSTLFLISYLIYHHFHGDTQFLGTGLIRPIYFFILISHILLSVIVLPMILVTFYFALTGKFTLHPKIARVTLPIWLYVSVTGVLIVVILRGFPLNFFS